MTIRDPKFNALEMPWARDMQAQVESMAADLARRSQNDLNVNQGQNSTIQNLGQNIVDLAGRVATAIAGIVLDMSQVPTGNLDQSRVTGVWSKTVSTSSTVTGADLYTINGPTFNITGGRVTCWLETATGRVAMATSSRRFKQDEITVTDVDPRAILSVNMKYWHYIAEVRKRDDPTFEDYVGPDYHVAQNFGPIAEDLHAAGLWMCVIYQHNDDGSLQLDENEQPIPFAIHDSLWGYLEHIAVQWLMGRVDDHEARLTKAGL
jgi:hypothetical protein